MNISAMSLVVVVGSPRSGTTMTAGLLRSAGAWFGTAATSAGMTNVVLQERVTRPFAQLCGVDPDDTSALPIDPTRAPRLDLVGVLERELKWQGWSGRSSQVVGLKDSLALGIVPSLVSTFPNAQVVVVRRDAEAIAESCIRTDWMKPHRSIQEWREWAGTWERTLSVLRDMCGERAHDFWPSTCVRGDFVPAREMCVWCGLEWNSKAAFEYVNPKHWGDGRSA